MILISNYTYNYFLYKRAALPVTHAIAPNDDDQSRAGFAAVLLPPDSNDSKPVGSMRA